MKLTMLGTGNAKVTECYNTCFLLNDENGYFLVDGGGGNGILKQLKSAGVSWEDIHDIFVTHRHMDHILGVMWLIRMFAQKMKREGYAEEVRIYGHKKVLCILDDLSHMLLARKEADFVGAGSYSYRWRMAMCLILSVIRRPFLILIPRRQSSMALPCI